MGRMARSGELATDDAAGGRPIREGREGRDRAVCQTGSVGRLTIPQRIVLVIGFGAGLCLVGGWIANRGRPVTGWTSYAPLTASSPAVSGPGLHPWVRMVIWLAVVVIWVVGSLVVLRSPRPSAAEDSSDPRQ